MVTAKIIVAPAVPLDLPRVAETEDVQVIFSVIVPEHGAEPLDFTASAFVTGKAATYEPTRY